MEGCSHCALARSHLYLPGFFFESFAGHSPRPIGSSAIPCSTNVHGNR